LGVAAAALLVAGCGGNGGGSLPAGASVVPGSAAAFIWVDTDLKSDQWRTAKALFDKFPGRAKLLAQLNKELTKQKLDFNRDVKPALGDEFDVVFLDFAHNGNDVVGLAKPHNRAKFEQLVTSGPDPSVTGQVRGWTVVADKQALIDRFRTAANGKSIADDDAFSKAFGNLDDNTIARAYVSGRALEQAYERGFAGQTQVRPQDFVTFGPIVASAQAQQGGARVDADAEIHVKLKPDPTPDPYEAKLPRELPAGALLYVSYAQLDREVRATINELERVLPNFRQQRAQVESALGTSLQHDIYPLLAGEAAFAIYPGAPIPRFEFVLALKNEAKARQLLERVNALMAFGGAAAPRTVQVGAARVSEVKVPGRRVTVDYAVFDHKLVIENGTAGIAALQQHGAKLAEDPLYKAARANGDTPTKSIGFVYANLRDGLPLAFKYARQSGSAIPADAVENTRPLQSLIVSFTRDGDHFTGAGFVGIK
jgi:hypothetical protein